MIVIKRVSLYFQDSRSDKVYTVELHQKSEDRYQVFAIYGRRNGPMKTDCKTEMPCRLDEAEGFFAQIVKEKKAKGYVAGDQAAVTQAPQGTREHAFAGLPAGPMLLNEVEIVEMARMDLIADDRWLLQPKWDGHRCWLSALPGGSVIGLSRTGKEKTLPLSVVEAARGYVSRHRQGFVIDGELIDQTFVCFDVLQTDGKDLWQDKAEYRAGYASAMWPVDGDSAIVSSTSAITRVEKENLYRACFNQGMEGVVLKRKDAAYSAGRPNSGGPGLKVKFVNTCEVICGGQRGEKRSVSMKLHDGTAVGSVTIPPNRSIPAAGEVLSVRYLYRGAEDGHLVQAVYLGTRDDIAPEACTAAQLRVKGQPRKKVA